MHRRTRRTLTIDPIIYQDAHLCLHLSARPSAESNTIERLFDLQPNRSTHVVQVFDSELPFMMLPSKQTPLTKFHPTVHDDA